MKVIITEEKIKVGIEWICEKFKKYHSEYVKDIEVYDKGYENSNHYAVRIKFYSGPDSKFWPLTQLKRYEQDEIANKLWSDIYNMIKQPVGIYIDR
jgi:hypothetical protein